MNIPDFAKQVQDIQLQIEAQSSVVEEDWSDSVQERYYQNFMERYKKDIDLYISGGMGMKGKGINDLMVYLCEQQQKLESMN